MPIISAADFISSSFDYLIVGGGTSGLVLAARLTEDPNVVVGVVEAGDYYPDAPEVNIPGLMGSTITNPKYDWTFFSVPQAHANDRVLLLPRGKALGGSSVLNFTNMCRPSKAEFDALEKLGNPGWNWDSLLTYMKKSECYIPRDLSPEDAEKYAAVADPEMHGTDGPIVKAIPNNLLSLSLVLLATMGALGVPRNAKHSGGDTTGALTSLTSVDPRTAKRSYAASAYYADNAGRPNLRVLTGAHATRVLLVAENGTHRAVGLEFIKDGVTATVTGIRRDVILSAGTYQTPQLLELSGIGNPSILRAHGIDCIIDLPGVGENYQDHVMVPTIVEVDQKYETVDILLEPEHLRVHQELYKQQKGLLSSTLGSTLIFLPTHKLGNDEDVQKWQALADQYCTEDTTANALPALRNGLKKQYELQKGWFFDRHQAQTEILHFIGHFPLPPLAPTPGKRYMTLLAGLLRPRSRGTVHIASSDALAPPAIDPNYLANPADVEVLTRTLEFVLRAYKTPPLAGAVRGYVTPPLADGGLGIEALRAYVRETCVTIYHPVGTASMLPRADGGVVDSALRVYGTSNLRVVDLSILPLVPSAHTQASAYAIAEKAADIIKGL